MGKREDRRKLELKRERLRQLTQLSTDEVGVVVGGSKESVMTSGQGNARSRTCP